TISPLYSSHQPSTTHTYPPSLHDALPILGKVQTPSARDAPCNQVVPSTMTATAPSAAPADTPMRVGSASGLRNNACINIPAHARSEEHTSELQSRFDLVCRLLLEKKKNTS